VSVIWREGRKRRMLDAGLRQSPLPEFGQSMTAKMLIKEKRYKETYQA